ncbi:MAG: HD domain-containing protein [bacterium]|nr:HD domain-containing protein [bacterium]
MIKKNLIKKLLIVFMVLCFFAVTTNKVKARSFLADKAEIPVTLDNSGARSLCQTDDGYVWIGQFAGLSRYDSRELVSFSSYIDENGETQVIENVRCLAHYKNTLFIVSSIGLIKYENHKFNHIDLNVSNGTDINDILVDGYGTLYISTRSGLFKYSANTNHLEKDDKISDNIKGVALHNDEIYLEKEDGIYDYNGTKIYESNIINTIYCYNDILVIARTDRMIYFYDLAKKEMLANSIKLSQSSDMAHKFTYSNETRTLFAAAEKGLYSIDSITYTATYASNLEKSSKLVDIIIDYEGNIWIASYTSGVSILTQSTLTDVLFDVSEDDFPLKSRLIYAIEKYGNELYLASTDGIYVYDYVADKLLKDHPLVTQINDIISYDKEQIAQWEVEHKAWEEAKEEWERQQELDPSLPDYDVPEPIKPDERIAWYDVRDIEMFKGKMYFATYGSGLFEYDPITEIFKQYRGSDINPADPLVNKNGYYAVAQRCLRAYDDYLFIGTSTNSIIRFDGTNFIFNKELTTNGQILYIDKSEFGDVTYVCSANGIHTINKDLENSSIKTIPGIDEKTSGILKFYQDGDNFFYNIYGRLFVITKNGNYFNEPKEIKLSYVNGSITEISKVKTVDNRGGVTYKHVLASEKQIYVIDDLLAENLSYEFYDESNGLKSSIKGNSSGFYDTIDNIYYFQSQCGVYSFDFNNTVSNRKPLKIAISSIKVDNKTFYGNKFKINKNAERISINLSIFSFKPTKGYKIYYKLDGIDGTYIEADNNLASISYTNLKGGKYNFHVYVVDEINQMSNQIDISFTKTKHIYEYVAFVVLMIFLGLALVVGALVYYFRRKIKQSIKRQLEYKKITLESIEAIARTIDAKDVYTNGHSRRVGYYSREIAKAMNLPEKQVENIFYTALLHDIGKIGIPLSIINKPARLDDEEYAIMKTHTTKGGKILKDISTIPGIVEGAMYHHERYDGTGYPTGLKGTNIPLNARIICCADCFDAMATKRSYKEPCSKEYIISEFERCSGTQFDPDIAKVVIELIKDDKFKTIIEENNEMKNDIITIEESKKD